MASQLAAPVRPLPGFSDELARAEANIAELDLRRKSNPADLEKRLRLAYRLFHRASLTGIMDHYDAVEVTISEILNEFGPREDLCLLKANLDFRFHRLPDVRRDLQMCPTLAARFEARTLLADLDFQEGRYQPARLQLEQLIAEDRSWDNLARLAHWKSKFGDALAADQLYEEAEDELTAKQMQSYSWLEIQRGLLSFKQGQYTEAARHYGRAERAFPGHWYTDEHFAELMAAEGKREDAVALLRQVLLKVAKPELQQAVGELYVACGREEEAQPWFDKAQAKYLESLESGGVHYFHHLADFYNHARKQPSEALRWARKDLALRSNFSTQAALAWALYRTDQLPEAIQYIRQALSSGVQDAEIFSMAATLFEAAGESAQSQIYAAAALRINPGFDNFHLHH